ncbi:hypothetical protein GGU45_001979 [Niabella hirudinis]
MLVPFYALLVQLTGGIKKCAVFKKLLIGALNLNDKRFAISARAGDIKNRFAVMLCRAMPFLGIVYQVANSLPTFEQGIQKGNQQVFTGFGTKDSFKTKIG